MTKAIVALVGRPNVGKSTLFNRIVGRRVAIVEDLPGTTRDRLYADADWGGVDFVVIDTGGLEMISRKELAGSHKTPPAAQTAGVESGLFLSQMRDQAQIAIAEADVVVFLVDAESGLTPSDQEVAEVLRRTEKPVILVANKADNDRRRADAVEFYALGLGDPLPVSALHGHGTGDLLDMIIDALPQTDVEEVQDERVKVAIVGRPNVGKSSLLNRLLGQERVIVSEVPGTTRDAIDMEIEFSGEQIVLIDTAGIRRRGKIAPGVEKYSVLRALKAINRADVCLLMIDAQDKVAAQDQHIAGYILDEAKSVVVTVNKWDLVEKDTHTMVQYTKEIRAALRFMDYVPILFISAKTGQRVQQTLQVALQVQAERTRRISTADLNRLLQEATARHPPKSKSGQLLKFYYVTQPEVDPPTFVFFVNDRELVHFTYQRYLENRIREVYGFLGTPLRLVFRSRR
ncbi:MAG: ribosome biogenesis GTPase Der [Anaerolineales bacterium]|nr:MAG: ribosome biogenesis GTPase Der [Anaerolineales bacterium]